METVHQIIKQLKHLFSTDASRLLLHTPGQKSNCSESWFSNLCKPSLYCAGSTQAISSKNTVHLENIHSTSLAWNSWKVFKHNKPKKYNMYIIIHSLCLVLCWSTFGDLQLQPEVFLSMMLQARHTYCLKIFFAEPLRLHQVWCGASVSFSDLSSVQLGSSLGSSWAMQKHSVRSQRHFFLILAVCLGLWSCGKITLCPARALRPGHHQGCLRTLLHWTFDSE